MTSCSWNAVTNQQVQLSVASSPGNATPQADGTADQAGVHIKRSCGFASLCQQLAKHRRCTKAYLEDASNFHKTFSSEVTNVVTFFRFPHNLQDQFPPEMTYAM